MAQTRLSQRQEAYSAYTTTATAAGTSTLTASSTAQQFFTGTTTQTVVLPVASTLTLGQFFEIYNTSTGVVTVQSSGANTVQAISSNFYCIVTCILISGTTAASWSVVYSPMSNTGGGGGTPGGSSTQVQYNNASAFAGATQVLIDTTDNNLTLKSTTGTTTVTAPSAGNAKLFTVNRTGLDRLAVTPSVGSEYYIQPSIARKYISSVTPFFAQTGLGYLSQGASFGPSTSNGFLSYNATNLLPNFNTLRCTTGTTANTPAGMSVGASMFTVGTTTYGGGTTLTFIFGLSTYGSTERIFVGAIGSASLGALPSGSVDPSTLLNIIGVGKDTADTTFQIMRNTSSGTATKVNTAITPNANDVYVVTIFIPSNSTTMYVTLEDYTKSAVTIFNSGALSTTLPVAGGMGVVAYVSNAATAAARIIDIIQVTCEAYF